MSETSMAFAHPELGMMMWIWAAIVLGLVWLDGRGSDALDRLVSGAMQGRLVLRPSRWRRWARIALLGISGFAMIVALMQPQWGLRYVATPRIGAEIMIALDVSRSMLADDAKPSRLERAKAEISDLLSYLDNDYVGLIAFAGRATILSPMTPDKSFLRLALDSAGAHSVTRGGTSLAEPILRAVAGMGEAGPAQRALILITDGEDHDSFALDAAKRAAEAGIKIITIGFGDEAGSQIYVRDAKTGARTLLRDGSGQPVVSRLDGDLLREIALTTDGAFVPAGTGVLDLASIYEAHIADLTRGQLDERGRTIRDEAYQFFVLLALICLIAAVSTSSGRGDRGVESNRVAAGLLACLLLPLSTLPATSARAQAPAPLAADPSSALEPLSSTAENERHEAADRGEDPREKFNRANARLAAGEAVAAEALFRDARRDVTDDTELRYAATYNLGVAAVARADAALGGTESKASEALDALYVAADWFREAAAARPGEPDPRHNLDVTLRRALILADEIAKTDQRTLEVELDEMIETQRQRVLHSAALLEQVARSGELDAAESLRSVFRDSATEQRLVLSDANTLAERVARERAGLQSKPEAERSPEDVLRIGQLDGVLRYLDGAIERMGQTRRQLRQRRAERAYRRGSNALSELKRARDQLRDPVAQIGILLAEVGRLAQSTGALASAGLSKDSRLPAFLTQESAGIESSQIEARVEELAEGFASAAERARTASALSGASPYSSDPTAPTSGEEVDQEAQRIALTEAAPLVEAAATAMARVTQEIGIGDYRAALAAEVEVGEALTDARERFFDLPQLLNTTFADEERIVENSAPLEAEDALAREEFAAAIVALQEKNLARTLRLEDLLDREERKRLAEIEAAEQAAPPMQAEEGAATPRQLEGQRFDLAGQRLALATGAMMEVTDALPWVDGETAPNWPGANEAAQRASRHLDGMRTLFFSMAEHLRKLAQDQVEVLDRTQDAIALLNAESMAESIAESIAQPIAQSTSESGEESPPPGSTSVGSPLATRDQMSGPGVAGEQVEQEERGPILRGPETLVRTNGLAEDQEGLESRAREISDALFVQAEEMAQAPAEEAGPEAEGVRIRKAAEFVASAGLAMEEAFETLKGEMAPLPPARAAQALAISDLQKALELLSPPPPPENPKSDDEQSQESEESEQGEPEPEPEPEPEKEEGAPSAADSEERLDDGMDDPSQLLQGVRDREAERRRDRDREDQRRRSVPVEKDW
jgi:Ca-activated chloride channel family protein